MTGGHVDISITLLRNIYLENNIVRRKASFKFNRKLNTPFQFLGEKVKFLGKLLKYFIEDRQIIYMDETSTHLWEKMKGFWMPKDDLIDITLNKERGHSRTIIGGISNKWEDLEYIITDKTNTPNVKDFLWHLKDRNKI